MNNHTSKIIAAVLMFAGSQIAAAGGASANDALSGLAVSAGVAAPEKITSNLPAPVKGDTYAQRIARYDQELRDGQLTRSEYDWLVAGARDLENMAAIAAGKPAPYPEQMPVAPRPLTPVQLVERYNQELKDGLITQDDYDYLVAGLRDLGQLRKWDQESPLDINRRAHKTVWTTLYATGQITTAFADSGDRRIAGFLAWRAGTPEPGVAWQLAGRLDGIFVDVRGARRNVPETRELLTGILSSGRAGGKNVRWLADKIDELYTFWGE